MIAVTLAALGVALTTTSPAGATKSSPCGTMNLSSTNYSHVIWVWMENHSYTSILQPTSAAHYEKWLAFHCGLASNYHNISHPSLPNYIGATSGLSESAVQAFSSDCSPSSSCDTSSPSIFGQVTSWKAYEESMPSNCDATDAGPYAVRHNPPPYYTTLSGCSTNDVPFTDLGPDLAGNTLPAFSFITPNLNHDMHDGTVAMGDRWLKRNLPAIFESSAYTSGTVVLFITWDEGEGGTSNNCATNVTDVGCHVVTIIVSPSTKPGSTTNTLFNHYSLLLTTEQLLGEPPLGQAATANSMLTAFNL
ncbi:MAG TPA: alkaline phosphatase family protein [Acidimicrobiales bacterium]|nr:alkaline phosphatase family protein [Acidimicrobiales bacterium]